MRWERNIEPFLQSSALQLHDAEDVPNILRCVASGADDALLCVSHMKQIDASGSVVYSDRNEPAFDFSVYKEQVQKRRRSSGIQHDIDISGFSRQRRCFAEIFAGFGKKVLFVPHIKYFESKSGSDVEPELRKIADHDFVYAEKA